MKKKLKKYLLTSLTLDSSTVAAGTVLTSCGEIEKSKESKPSNESNDEDISNLAHFNWDPSLASASDPGSLINLSIDEDKGLTADQIKYNQDLAKKILVNFNKLDELNKTKKISNKVINYLYGIYFSNIKNGPLKPFAVYASLDYENIKYFYSTYYDSFSQKNLLPTEDEFNHSYLNTSRLALNSDEWKITAGIFAVFYTDPMDILMIAKLIKLFPESIKDVSGNIEVSLSKAVDLVKKLLLKPLSKESSAYQALMFYEELLNKI